MFGIMDIIPYYKGKVEVVNLHPKIVLYHDVLSEAEISYIRNEGRDKVIYDQNVAHLKDHPPPRLCSSEGFQDPKQHIRCFGT
jgi:homoaconitase/3-isopropylmalate dehydratase large subunit